LSDQHHYPPVPHTSDIITFLRTLNGSRKPVFLSEYGIGSAVNLVRLARLYEQNDSENAEDAVAYKKLLDKFMVDWEKWNLKNIFGDPLCYFNECISRMGEQRLFGINAIRSNPNIIGYSATGTVDQGFTAEGFFTTFRELKPGTTDAVNDGFAPLRWCTFAEPVQVFRDSVIHLEAVLANENILGPGDYPVSVLVKNQTGRTVYEKTVTLKIPELQNGRNTIFAVPCFKEDVKANWGSGKYSFNVIMEKGGAPSGGKTDFWVNDQSDMPNINGEITIWGEDKDLSKWLTDNGMKVISLKNENKNTEIIIVGNNISEKSDSWVQLAKKVAGGSIAIFLCPHVFAKGEETTRMLPVVNKGKWTMIQNNLYVRDDWVKPHPVFAGLPTGIMDFFYYREIIPNNCFIGIDSPDNAIAGGIKTSLSYDSGLLMAEYNFGAGKFIINSLKIRENIGIDPVAEKILRNLIIYGKGFAGKKSVPLNDNIDKKLKEIGYLEAN